MIKRQVEVTVPCTAMMADGAFRGAILGTIWGCVTDLELLESLIAEQQLATPRIVRRMNAVGRSAAGFALFIGAYSGGCCLGAKLTGHSHDHWIPAFFGGFFGGTIFSVRSRSLALCVGIGSTTGAFASVVKYLQS